MHTCMQTFANARANEPNVLSRFFEQLIEKIGRNSFRALADVNSTH